MLCTLRVNNLCLYSIVLLTQGIIEVACACIYIFIYICCYILLVFIVFFYEESLEFFAANTCAMHEPI